MHAWSGRLIIENGTGAEVNQGLVALADLLMREGVHPEKTTLPYTPGWDLVGVVEEIGKEASQAKVGQMVAARPIQGGYAQHICLPQGDLCVPKLHPGAIVTESAEDGM